MGIIQKVIETVDGMNIDSLYIAGSIMLICIFLLALVIVIWGLGKDNEELSERVKNLENEMKSCVQIKYAELSKEVREENL